MTSNAVIAGQLSQPGAARVILDGLLDLFADRAEDEMG